MLFLFRLVAGACALIPLAAAAPACAQAAPDAATPADSSPDSPRIAVHGQMTFTVQATPGFASPYAGANSLTPHQAQETFDATAAIGLRLWRGAELWADPEIDQGFGLSNTLGAAGFTSGEAYKVGKSNPYFKLQRVFLRQTIDLGGAAVAVDAGANQMRGRQTANRLVITLGKLSVGDVFDTNAYAHDPRGDFLNWSVIDTGSFDYAANAWGYTYGGAVEWYQGAWTLRAGLFDLSKVPNDTSLEIDFSQYQIIGELEHRHSFGGHPGALRIGFFDSRARLARLADVIAAYDTTGSVPDLAGLRHATGKWGVQIDAEQEVSANLGLFLRAGWNDGRTEAEEFTEIDRTLALGGQIGGGLWGRAGDKIGFAGVVNGISKARQQFLADGGQGILIGDGRLPHPGAEWIAETYYSLQVRKGIALALDYQLIANPGYNRDRGPAHVFALRLHGGF